MIGHPQLAVAVHLLSSVAPVVHHAVSMLLLLLHILRLLLHWLLLARHLCMWHHWLLLLCSGRRVGADSRVPPGLVLFKLMVVAQDVLDKHEIVVLQQAVAVDALTGSPLQAALHQVEQVPVLHLVQTEVVVQSLRLRPRSPGILQA